ncbi:colicin V synthesis protein [Acinetobacter indicus]|uniref:CvpA family protein n=1 Tax=Acinetobacter indicus TaxID=756892 RepID=UPI0005F7A1F2|nr:CvpA family protein [Acinetobacter indicus]KJV45582.1 colicin V synthesis protein [Acinetobacter indicus]OUY11251.1 colicin V synthesis protein [Acinetobacter indicus]
MNAIDIFILIILLIGGLNGLRQGFIKAFANLVGWIFALIVAAKYASVLAPSMTALSADPVVQKIAAFAFIVLVIVVLTWMVSALLNRILKSLKLGPLNRLAGGAFGTLKGLLIVLIAIQGIGPWVESSPHWKQSKFIQTLLPYAPWATQMSKDAANEALQHIKSEDTPKSSGSSSEPERKGTDESTNNPFY